MSFTSIVKDELSKQKLEGMQSLSELSAIINSSSKQENKIIIDTENNSLARHIYSLLKEINIIPKIIVRKTKVKYMYVLEINNKVKYLYKELGLINEIPSDFIIADDDLKRAFLKGVFLMTASINDPKTSRYHLEFNLGSKKYADFIMNLLNEYDMNSKVLKRENRYMVYIKEAEKIGDFLRILGAYNAVLYYEDIRIYRDHKNMTNRLNNCEQANVDKIVESANNQVKDILLIQEKASLDLLSLNEQIVAQYRLKYREVSLLELSQIISIETEKPITKSGIYHRMKKIQSLAERIRKNSN